MGKKEEMKKNEIHFDAEESEKQSSDDNEQYYSDSHNEQISSVERIKQEINDYT